MLEKGEKFGNKYTTEVLGDQYLINNDRNYELHLYMQEVCSVPLLDSHQERILLQKISDGDQEAKNDFIKANLRLSVNIAKRYIGRGVDFEDLIQAGNEGMLKAVDNFNLNYKNRFSTYATRWIKGLILKEIYGNSQEIRLNQHVYAKLSKINKAVTLLNQNLGRKPNTKELSISTGFSEQKVVELLSVPRVLTQSDSDNDDSTETMSVNKKTVQEFDHWQMIKEQEYSESMHELLELLGDSESKRRILLLKLEFNGNNKLNNTTIAKKLGISKQAVQQALKRMKAVTLGRIELPSRP